RVRIFSRAISNTRLKNARLFLLLLYFITAIFNCLHKLKSAKATKTILLPKGDRHLLIDRTNSKPVIPVLIKTPAPKKKGIWKRLKAKLAPVSTPDLLSPFLLIRRNV
ncbi:hypothetical protein GGTG_02588, partial [Gaeumannomyces tritici R3-111a-1]